MAIDLTAAFSRVHYREELLDSGPQQLRSLLAGLDSVCREDTPALNELRDWVSDRLDELELEAIGEGENVVEVKRGKGVTYQLELVKCGKQCKVCQSGGHGPYWYAYRRNKNRVTKKYIGKQRSQDD